LPSLSSIVNSIGGSIYSRWGGSGWPFSTVVVPGARYDYEANAYALWSNSVVAIAIKWLGDRFPKPRIQISKVQRNGKWKPVPNHPVEMLWKRPNEYYTRRAMEKAIGLSLLTDGNAYLMKVRNGAGKVAELWWMPSDYINPMWTGKEFISGYKVIVPGEAPRDVPRSEVIHVRDGMDPLNPRKGLSAIKSQLREVGAINEEGSYTPAILRNCGVPGVVLSPKTDEFARSASRDEKGAKQIKEAFEGLTKGENRGGSLVLKGPYDVVSIGFSPEQLALDKIMQLPMAKVAGACGVALMSMGLPDPGKTYSNLEAANKYSWGTVCAIQEMIGEAVTHDLLPEFGFDPIQYAVGYDYGDVQELQEEEKSLWDRVGKGWQASLVTQNEARDLLGMQPDPDGDRYYYELQTAIAMARNPQHTLDEVESEAASQDAPVGLPAPSANGNGKPVKRWEY
jgi:HK97 family phage portal protein